MWYVKSCRILSRKAQNLSVSAFKYSLPCLHKYSLNLKFCWIWEKCMDFSQFLPREAMLSAVYAVVVCLSVCLSVTLRYCIKTAKRRITQTTPHDSHMTLVFWCQRSWRNSKGITPYGGDKCRWGGLKLVTFDKKHAITQKRYKTDI